MISPGDGEVYIFRGIFMDNTEKLRELLHASAANERNALANQAVHDNLYNKGFRAGYHKGWKDGAEAIAYHNELLVDELVTKLMELPTQENIEGQDMFFAYDVIRMVKEHFEEKNDDA